MSHERSSSTHSFGSSQRQSSSARRFGGPAASGAPAIAPLAPGAAHSAGHNFGQISVFPPPAAVAQAAPLQRQAEEADAEEMQEMQLKADGPAPRPDVPVASSGGSALPPAVQAKMEASFGTNFSNVRVHTGSEAKQVGALAYTRGANIHFQPGQYDPHTEGGQALLGHELAHVVQQRAGRVQAPRQNKGGQAPINADPALEAEADALGAKAARGEPAR